MAASVIAWRVAALFFSRRDVGEGEVPGSGKLEGMTLHYVQFCTQRKV
jgi:hypothetical protein